MKNSEKLLAALDADNVEIIIRKTTEMVSVSSSLQDQIIDYIEVNGAKSGKEIRQYISELRGVPAKPIANEVAWALVELQSSTRKRSSFIDGKGPIEKIGGSYQLNRAYESAS